MSSDDIRSSVAVATPPFTLPLAPCCGTVLLGEDCGCLTDERSALEAAQVFGSTAIVCRPAGQWGA